MITDHSFKHLRDGIHQLGLDLSVDQIDLLRKYILILLKWNKTYNLTAITDIDKIITYHILDGLSIMHHIQFAQTILDIGSGMGIPGIMIAICYPLKHIWVVDCNHKKIAFLQQLAIELNLTNLTIVCKRIEDYSSDQKYDLAISRAFSDTQKFITLLRHLSIKQIMLMKSKKVHDELTNVPAYQLISLIVPGIVGTRYLLVLTLD